VRNHTTGIIFDHGFIAQLFETGKAIQPNENGHGGRFGPNEKNERNSNHIMGKGVEKGPIRKSNKTQGKGEKAERKSSRRANNDKITPPLAGKDGFVDLESGKKEDEPATTKDVVEEVVEEVTVVPVFQTISLPKKILFLVSAFILGICLILLLIALLVAWQVMDADYCQACPVGISLWSVTHLLPPFPEHKDGSIETYTEGLITFMGTVCDETGAQTYGDHEMICSSITLTLVMSVLVVPGLICVIGLIAFTIYTLYYFCFPKTTKTVGDSDIKSRDSEVDFLYRRSVIQMGVAAIVLVLLLILYYSIAPTRGWTLLKDHTMLSERASTGSPLILCIVVIVLLIFLIIFLELTAEKIQTWKEWWNKRHGKKDLSEEPTTNIVQPVAEYHDYEAVENEWDWDWYAWEAEAREEAAKEAEAEGEEVVTKKADIDAGFAPDDDEIDKRNTRQRRIRFSEGQNAFVDQDGNVVDESKLQQKGRKTAKGTGKPVTKKKSTGAGKPVARRTQGTQGTGKGNAPKGAE